MPISAKKALKLTDAKKKESDWPSSLLANGSDSWFHESIRWPIWFSGRQHQPSVSQILTLELCPQCRWVSWNYTWKHIRPSPEHQKHRLGRYQFNASKGMKLKARNSKMNGFLAYGKDKILHSVYNVSSQRLVANTYTVLLHSQKCLFLLPS